MNEMALKFDKISLFLASRTFRIPEMLFDSLDVNLRHTLKSKECPGTKKSEYEILLLLKHKNI